MYTNTNRRRTAKANLRNNDYPTNVPIIGVKDIFRIFEVVADGRCLFGTMWLLIKEPSEINQLLREKVDYKEIEDFNDNGGLNQWIKNLFASLTKCQKIKMMAQYFLSHGREHETEQISDVIGLYDTDNPLIEKHCNIDSPENIKMVNTWYENLSESGVVGKFDEYLLSLHTNQTPYEDFEDSYRYSDIELFGNVLSDIFFKNINLVQSTEGIYQGNYKVYMKYTGKPDKMKEDIYIYYKANNHFQPMIPNSILEISNRGRPSSSPSSAAVSSINTYDDLKSKFPQFDASIISQVFEAHNKDIASTNNILQEMIENTGQPYAQELQKLIEFGYLAVDAGNALKLTNGNVEQAVEILLQTTEEEKPNSRRDTQRSSTYDNLSENEGPHNDLDRVQGEKNACIADKKFLIEYFTFPKKLKIKYVGPNNISTDLPSTGFFGSMKGSTSTTDRIKGKESETDNVYTKVSTKFKNPITQVEIRNGQNIIVNPSEYVNATEDWYFLVTLGGDLVARGGRTRKRHPQRGRMRSQKKRKMRILKRRTKRPRRFSQTKRQKQ
jgi:hypothetical protein